MMVHRMVVRERSAGGGDGLRWRRHDHRRVEAVWCLVRLLTLWQEQVRLVLQLHLLLEHDGTAAALDQERVPLTGVQVAADHWCPGRDHLEAGLFVGALVLDQQADDHTRDQQHDGQRDQDRQDRRHVVLPFKLIITGIL